jgi:hypothetical protein
MIVADAESRFTPRDWWPPHPRDLDPGDDATPPATPLYHGACGVVWALHYLQDVGAVRLQRNYREPALMADLLARNKAWLGVDAAAHAGSFMMGELPIRLLEHAAQALPATADRLAGRGAPGFVVCLADLPGHGLDDVLAAAGEAVWAAGPLSKGSNLCHGTGGNGYAFLKLYQRTGDAMWLQRAQAFAMHSIAQTEADAQLYGQMRYSLWTGDPGFANYLWDCLQRRADFPTLDVFYGSGDA